MRELERDRTQARGPRAGAVALGAITIVGAGRAGTAFAGAARASGLDVRLAGRTEAEAAAAGSDVVLLCVPDAEIQAAAAVAAGARPAPRFVGHVSGAVGLDVLAAAGDAGAGMFGLHPLQTLPDGDARLAGAACAVSGSDDDARELATGLAERLGMRPFPIEDADRAAYHAAASMASNFLVALEESAAGLLAAAGIADGRELLAPLVARTAANWAERGPAALTGRIASGDEATVARHREALATTAPEFLPLYDELAKRTRALAKEPVA
jgi:predicted short-subunit dehydrogenase-like oxidoreductase (DUF2520 family)